MANLPYKVPWKNFCTSWNTRFLLPLLLVTPKKLQKLEDALVEQMLTGLADLTGLAGLAVISYQQHILTIATLDFQQIPSLWLHSVFYPPIPKSSCIAAAPYVYTVVTSMMKKSTPHLPLYLHNSLLHTENFILTKTYILQC